jgi:hypothetical protein
MADMIVPLTSDPDQTFKITLPVNNKNLTLGLRFRYNTEGIYWYMSITDSNGNLLIDAIPLLCGDFPAANMLGQYSYLNIGSAFIIKVGTAEMDSPDDTNLGTEFVLVWGDNY